MSDNQQSNTPPNSEPPQNTLNTQSNQENQDNNQGGFFNSFMFRMICMMFIMNIFSRFFKNTSLNPNLNKSLQLKNFMYENPIFDLEFYISPNDDLNRFTFLKKEIQPVSIFENLNYTDININTTEFTKEVELKWNLEKYKQLFLDFDPSTLEGNSTKLNSSEFSEKNNKIEKLYSQKILNKLKSEELFLYTFIRFKNLKDYKILEGFKNAKLLTTKINILKYSDSLKNEIHQQNMLTDLEMIDSKNPDNSKGEDKVINFFKDKKFIKNLYHKSEISFYFALFENLEDIENFQEFRTMGIPSEFDLENFKFFPNPLLTDFWNMNSDLKFIMVDNNNVEKQNFTSSIKIKINFNFLSNFYFKFLRAIEINSEMMEKNFNIPSSKDMFVELLKNNSVFYLAILFTVNILHTIFSYLGFASDVSYYKNLKELDGVYTKYIFFSIFRLLITFIYVYLEDAHFLVKIELFVALLVEIWKLRKIFSIKFSTKFPFVEMEYKIKFALDTAKTHENEAIRITTKFLFFPIAILYLSYRIYYYKQNIYSSYFRFGIQYLFFLFNLFGFVLMTPQIYINYRLKSVAHMPIKALTFKFLNTIIDDLYAFAIKTTTLYRVSCFKDDVIFVIFIVQMFWYRKNIRKESEDEIVNIELKSEKSKELKSE